MAEQGNSIPLETPSTTDQDATKGNATPAPQTVQKEESIDTPTSVGTSKPGDSENKDKADGESRVEAEPSASSDDPACPDAADTSTEQDEYVKKCRDLLENAREELRNVPDDIDNDDRATRMLTVASCMGDYLTSVNSTDEGAFIEALELAAKAEGLASPNCLTHGRAMYTQMQTCYSMYHALKNPEWLRQGVKYGEDSVKTLSNQEEAWLSIMEPWIYRQYYSNRCERVANGYKLLFDEDQSAESIKQAVTWQGEATDATESTDGGEDMAPFEKKYWRFQEWLRLWVINMDKNTQYQLAGPISLAIDIYPRDLNDKKVGMACYLQILNLKCREWAITRDEATLDQVIEYARGLIVYNNETKGGISSTFEGKWYNDPDNRQHVLRVAATFFDWYYYMSNEEQSQWYQHLPSIKTLIALWEEWRRGHKQLTIGDLQEDMDPVIYLGDLYARKYGITNVAADGWRYDDLTFENCRMVSTINSGLSKEDGSNMLIEDSTKGVYWSTIGTSIVTRQDYSVSQSGSGERGWDWMAARRKFKIKIGESRPPCVEDWIRDRSDDGKWILGGAIEGRDDDILEYIRDYSKPYQSTGAKKEIEPAETKDDNYETKDEIFKVTADQGQELIEK